MENEPDMRPDKLVSAFKTAFTAAALGRLIRNLIGLFIVSAIMLLLVYQGLAVNYAVAVILVAAGVVVVNVINLKQTIEANLDKLEETALEGIQPESAEEPVHPRPGKIPQK